MKRNIDQIPFGVTMVELMVVFLIVAALSLGVWTATSGLIQKSNLINAAENMQNILVKAQNEGRNVGKWSCVKLNSGNLMVYRDDDNNHATSACGSSGDKLMFSTALSRDPNVSLSTCTNGFSFSQDCTIWVNEAGEGRRCPSDTSCEPTVSGTFTTCIPWDYQLIFTNSDMTSDIRSREVEFTQFGKVSLVLLGDKGTLASAWAKHPDLSGSGECQ